MDQFGVAENTLLWLTVSGAAAASYYLVRITFKQSGKRNFFVDHLGGAAMGAVMGVCVAVFWEMAGCRELPSLSEDATSKQEKQRERDDTRMRNQNALSIIIVCAVFGLYGARKGTGRRMKCGHC